MSKRDDYFERAAGWATDGIARSERNARLAWTIVGVLAVIAMLEAVALLFLTPLKSTNTVALLVDRQTGYVQSLDPTSIPRLTASEALTRSLLAQYVVAREGFNRATVALDYRRVALWSTSEARTGYVRHMAAGSDDSPLRYPSRVVVAATVKSISKIAPETALVRFDLQTDNRDATSTPQPWIAIIRYRFIAAPMKFADRLINPLGFQVISYRRDPEAPVESKQP